MSLEELKTKQLELLDRRRAAEAAVHEAERKAGEALLDSPDGQGSSAPAAAIGKARDAVTAIDAALAQCRARRLETIRSKRQSDAAAARKQVGALTAERERLERDTKELMERLSALQGIPFTSMATYPDRASKSQLLTNEILNLSARATNLEAELPTAGGVDVQSRDGSVGELLEAVLLTEADGPDVQAVLDWISAVQANNSKSDFGSHERRFHLCWRERVIDPETSFIEVSALARTSTGECGGTVWLVGSDQFRAVQE